MPKKTLDVKRLFLTQAACSKWLDKFAVLKQGLGMISVYKLARKILPLSLQARLGNRHNIKRKTIDPLLFRFTSHPGEERLFYQRAPTPMPQEKLEGNPFIPAPVAATYRHWHDKVQTQQVVKVTGDIYLDPVSAWPMGASNQLYLSLNPAGISPYMAVPAYRSIFHKSPMRSFDKIINLRDINEVGYSHFYSDIMARLALITRHGLSLKDYTLIISKKVAETAYGRYLIAHAPIFKEAGDIFLQDNEFVHCHEGLFAHATVNPTANFEMFKEVIAQAKAACPIEGEIQHRKIFLTRARTRRRAMRNGDVIEEIVKARGFEIVDADTLTLPQQIAMFTHCRHLVGIHGAGLDSLLALFS